MSGDRENRLARLKEIRRSRLPDLNAADKALLKLLREEKLAQKLGESSSEKKGETTSAGGNDDDDDGETEKEGSGCDAPRNLKCSHCEAWCTTVGEMEQHLARRHSSVQPLKCPYCDDFQCFYLLSMQIHLNEFHDVTLE